MKIQGLQKLTLLDYPEKVACTVFFAGCNFRCPFCHNASLVVTIPKVPQMNEEEFFGFLKKRQGILDGVCITGGEPLLQTELEPFIRKIKELGFAVKLDTNGSLPEKLKYLVKQGLVDYVAMDIKNAPERYGETCGISDMKLEKIHESVEYLKKGHVPYEFRTTIVKDFHSALEMEQIGKWLSGAKQYFLQGFVDSGDLIEQGLQGLEVQKMQEFQGIAQKYIENVQLRGV